MAKYEDWIKGDGLILLEGWARDGLTDEQIAHNIGISRSTLNEWKNKYSVIADTLKKTKEVVDRMVENALFKKAMDGDTTAQIFWLKNRRSHDWRDRKETAVSGSLDTTKEINVNFVKADKDER
jgi:transcriptional regulator with XRE-family HTH domain